MQIPFHESEWFLPVFVVFWLAIIGFISLVSGWNELAKRYKSSEDVEGERFRFRSGAVGWRAFPASYGSCLFATVGPKGFRLSIFFPFRFLHPPLVIPWVEVERCEETRVMVHEVRCCLRQRLWSLSYVSWEIGGEDVGHLGSS